MVYQIRLKRGGVPLIFTFSDKKYIVGINKFYYKKLRRQNES